jgi:hypothetical protein
MEWSARKKKQWLGYGSRGGEDHITYTCELYGWGVCWISFQIHELLYFSIPKPQMFKL